MPRFEFKSENVKKNLYDFPKLRLKKNEIARIVLLEDPEGNYTHNLRKPKLVNGIPETEMKNRRDGSQYEDFKYDFVSNVICLGDFATLEANGSDPKNCPACLEASRSDRVQAPKRRFAMHVIQYGTKPGTSDVSTPYSVKPVIWAYTDKVFGQLFQIKEEWGDLRKRDLILKCTIEPFQTYEITVASKAAWMEDKERMQLTAQAFKENRAEKLEVFVGTQKERKYLEMDLQQIHEAYNIAEGTAHQSSADAALNGVGSLSEGLDDLLSSSTETSTEETTTESAPEAVGSFDDLLNEDSGDDSLAASVGADEKAAESSSSTDDELDNLLNDLV